MNPWETILIKMRSFCYERKHSGTERKHSGTERKYSGMKILVVEDIDEIYDYYTRFFGTLLSLDSVEIVRVSNLKAASEEVLKEWDVILMDYLMGEAHIVSRIDSANIDPIRISNGADLVTFCRKFARGEDAFIIGTSPSLVYNERLVKAGASTSQLKHQVEAVAAEIKRRM